MITMAAEGTLSDKLSPPRTQTLYTKAERLVVSPPQKREV
jgi:hypothetical protein